MGLDIILYKDIKFHSNTHDDAEMDNIFDVFNLNSFYGHCRLREGMYTHQSYEHVLSVGYGTYGRFRDWLSLVCGYNESKDGIHEWIENLDRKKLGFLIFHFADNEGTWDFFTCKQLLFDLRKIHEIYDAARDPYSDKKNHIDRLEKLIFALDSVSKNDVISFT